MLYYFWNKLISEDDETLTHFFIVSLIEYYSEEIICSDLSHIPSLISSMALKDFKMVDEIFENAKRLRAITPYSFRLFFDKMEIFNPFSNKHKENFELYKPESLLCLPILPSEIFYITYNNLLKCPDRSCQNFIDKEELDNYNEMCDNPDNTKNERIKREAHYNDNFHNSNDHSENSDDEVLNNYDTFGNKNGNDNYESSEGNVKVNKQVPIKTEGIYI